MYIHLREDILNNMESTELPPLRIHELRSKIVDEIGYAMGLGKSGWRRRLLGPLFNLPAQRFAHIAARFEAQVPAWGLPGGARQLLSDLALQVTTRGAEQIPKDGPLLVVSNHPGAYDSVAILAAIPRKDIKLLVSDIPFLRAVPETSHQFIFVPAESDGRMAALRAAVHHLQARGAVMIFAHGDVEPDPGFMYGAWDALGEWSASIEILLRRVPDAWLQLAIASDVLVERFVRSPLARLRPALAQQQKLAEFLQVIQQMVLPKSVRGRANISFALPVCARDLDDCQMMPAIIDLARCLLVDHLDYFHLPARRSDPTK